jgi:hypothetical protein
MTSELPEFTSDFINENKKLSQTMSKSKNGGPYPKHEKIARRSEVYRLHFDYGYSGRKIADLMKINRNTINSDINYWYSKLNQKTNPINPRNGIIATFEKLNFQRTRLREQIDKVTTTSEKIDLERLLFDVDSKIWYIYHRIAESRIRARDLATQMMNKWFKQNKRNERAITYFDTIKVSKKARDRIKRIIKEDQGTKS